MDSVLRHHKWKGRQVYLDDLCVFGETLKKHNERLEEVLRSLDQTSLSLNIKKCSFGATKILLLGQEISEGGIRPDTRRIHRQTISATSRHQQTRNR